MMGWIGVEEGIRIEAARGHLLQEIARLLQELPQLRRRVAAAGEAAGGSNHRDGLVGRWAVGWACHVGHCCGR